MASRRATAEERRAAALYREFRESEPTRARVIRGRWPRAVMVMGYVDAIEYSTTVGGKGRRYRHKFARGSRAMLCATPKLGALFIIGGHFHVTDRGIVDLTPRGREIED